MLYDFQQQIEQQSFAAWSEGALDLMVVSPTGSGKTVTFCDVAMKLDCPAVAISHRQELVSQSALAFNREHVPHAIIAPDKIIKQIIALEHEEHGYSTFNSRAHVRVAGIDTLIRLDAHDRWFSDVGLVIQDEGHHQLQKNKWGRGRLMFPNARGYATTAHAVRADNCGLGRDQDGFIDRLIIGPYGRQLINRGFLTDYRIVCAGSDIEFAQVPIGPSGEFNMPKLRAVTHANNHLVGNVVKAYLQYAPGKLGLTFAVDKEEAAKLATAYNLAGVPAQVISDETLIGVRGHLMRKFRNREILQLVSVDCLGEGTDVPAVEVISLVRKTASWQILCQQFGRGLRVLVDDQYKKSWHLYTDAERLAIIAASPKSKVVIIDHVGNILWHAKFRGLPDSEQTYSLLRGETSKGKSDAIPYRMCLECKQPYEAYLIACPHCGCELVPAGRSTPELVEGDLIELDPLVLQALRGEVARVMGPVHVPSGMPSDAVRGMVRNHHNRYKGQVSLQHAMSVWGGWTAHRGLSDREGHKLFFFRFGVDYMSAQAFGTKQAAELEARIYQDLQQANVVERAS